MIEVRAPPWQPGHGPCGRSEGHGAGPGSNGRARSRPERDQARWSEFWAAFGKQLTECSCGFVAQADQTRFRRPEDFGAPGGRAGPPGHPIPRVLCVP